ncbi:MAG: hypothetical protein BMS9Abin11_0546 [Gammaproteobacteria bacterium]|nr:MAG: hypothetical protein BMS9Abin11_0546 [Gammaproteobacteria bacterium]
MKLKQRIVKAAAFFAVLAFLGGCASTKTTPKDETKTNEVASTPTARAESADGTYNVVRGDHLWGISSKPRIYGNPYQWPLIYKANSDQIKDADLIHPGQALTISRGASSGDISAAVQHAKNRGAWEIGVTEESDKRYLSR